MQPLWLLHARQDIAEGQRMPVREVVSMNIVQTVSGMPLLEDDGELVEFSHQNFTRIQSALAVDLDLIPQVQKAVVDAVKEVQSLEMDESNPTSIQSVIDQMGGLHFYRIVLDIVQQAVNLRIELEAEQSDAPEKVS